MQKGVINNDNNELHADNDPKYADKDREQKKDVSDRVFIKAEPQGKNETRELQDD